MAVDARVWEAAVLKAIESLYDDELKPYGRIIRKRLVEQGPVLLSGILEHSVEETGGSGQVSSEMPTLPLPSSQDLRSVCSACTELEVQAEGGGEWSALLRHRAPVFVDIYSQEDIYPAELWRAAAMYFEAGSSGEPCHTEPLPGGRYDSARELLLRQPQFLRGCSLGQVCHIMELCISKKSLLGYANGSVVPYRLSTSMLKSQCAEQQLPCSPTALDPSLQARVATWDEARDRLRQILQDAIDNGAKQVPLSNVKRLFRSKFALNLSETALGHARISNLLQDPRFRDICSVELQDRGYAVVPPRNEPEVEGEEEAEASGQRKRKFPPPPLDEENLSPSSYCQALRSRDHGSVGDMVHRTFIHAPMPPPTPMGPSASRRAHSVPKNMCIGRQPSVHCTPMASDLSSGRPRPRRTAAGCQLCDCGSSQANVDDANDKLISPCTTLKFEGMQILVEDLAAAEAMGFPAQTPSPQWAAARWGSSPLRVLSPCVFS